MRAVVITAIYDRFDTLKPIMPQDGVDVEWVCVTDDPDLSSPEWTIIHHPWPGVHPCRAAKLPKFRPWLYTSADASVWIDASYFVASSGFVASVLAEADPIAQFSHPWRSCIFEEAEHSLTLPKYAGEPIKEQVDEYRRVGHPEHWGLWATGVIARHHTDAVKAMGRDWIKEIRRWSFQDQISQPVVLRGNDLRPVPLFGNHLVNPWLTYQGSARH